MKFQLKSFILMLAMVIGMSVSCMQEADSPVQPSNGEVASVSEQLVAVTASMDKMGDIQTALQKDIQDILVL